MVAGWRMARHVRKCCEAIRASGRCETGGLSRQGGGEGGTNQEGGGLILSDSDELREAPVGRHGKGGDGRTGVV